MLHTDWWPPFNIADIAVVCDSIALAVAGWRAADRAPDHPTTADSGASDPAVEP